MAQDLLSLVETLIGNVMAGNVFSNTKQYSDVVRTNPNSGLVSVPPPVTPVTTPSGPSQLDTLPPDVLASTFDARRAGPTANQNAFALQSPGDVIPQPVGVMDGTYRQGNIYSDSHTYATPSYGLLRTLDVAAIANWFVNVGKQVLFLPSTNNDPLTRQPTSGLPGETAAKSTAWLASQFLLASMNTANPGAYSAGNLIWNPLSLPLSNIPGARGLSVGGITPTGITGQATGLFGTYKAAVQDAALAGVDRLSLLRQGNYVEFAPVARVTQLRSPIATPGFYGDIAKAGESDTLEQEQLPFVANTSVQNQVDGGSLTILAQKMGLHTNLYTAESPYGPNSAVAPLKSFDNSSADPQGSKLSSLFNPTQFPGGTITSFGPNAYNFLSKVNPLLDQVSAVDNADAPGLNAATTDANFFADNPDTWTVQGQPIADNEIYMPFMFQDLRDGQAPNEQFLYFRAFLKGDIAETFTPDWQTDRYYGRVDQIPTYLGTSRTVGFTFDIVAWSASDLPVIYTKLQKLQSMVYPSYTGAGFLNNAPIIRLRIGDLIGGFNNRGLPGYITSLDLAYDDGIWNIQEDFKVPRKISVNISYTVLHDGNPGIYPFSQKTVNVDGTVTGGDTNTTFGAGKFSRNDNGTFTATVSVRDIRKIFGTVRNIAT